MYSVSGRLLLDKRLDLSGGPGLGPGDITGTYSCSKGAAAFVIALLVQDGLLDLDATVASYWPGFGARGKDMHEWVLRDSENDGAE